MDMLKIKFYIEALGVAVGIVLLIVVIPLQIFVEREIRPMTVFLGMILWYTIIFHNDTFQELKEKWLKR